MSVRYMPNVEFSPTRLYRGWAAATCWTFFHYILLSLLWKIYSISSVRESNRRGAQACISEVFIAFAVIFVIWYGSMAGKGAMFLQMKVHRDIILPLLFMVFMWWSGCILNRLFIRKVGNPGNIHKSYQPGTAYRTPLRMVICFFLTVVLPIYDFWFTDCFLAEQVPTEG